MRKFVTNALLVVCSTLISLIGADALFRLYESNYLNREVKADGGHIDLAKMGFNDTSVEAKKPSTEFRIFSTGDSFCYSIVTNDLSYNGIAQSCLNSMGNTTRIVNLGEAGTTFIRYWPVYHFFKTRVEHDAVIFNIFLGNDLIEASMEKVIRPPHIKPVSQLMVESEEDTLKIPVMKIPEKFPLRWMDHLWARYLVWTELQPPTKESGYTSMSAVGSMEGFMSLTYSHLSNYDKTQVAKSYEKGFRLLAQFAEKISEVRKSGERVLVLLSPEKLQVSSVLRKQIEGAYRIDLSEPKYDFRLLNALVPYVIHAVDPNIQVIDLTDEILAHEEESDSCYYGTNTHWSRKGNLVVGKLLSNVIAESWFSQGTTPISNFIDPIVNRRPETLLKRQ